MNLKKILKGFVFAFKGILTMVKEEVNARIHLSLMTVVIVAGVFFQVSLVEWSLLVLAIVAVLGAEAINSAIESLTDLVSPDIHPTAGKVKDLAAGAVLIISVGAATIGLIIFLPKIWAYLKCLGLL